MNRNEFDALCSGLPGATHVVQWGGASVWKVGGKVFAIGGWSDPPEFAVTFKCSAASFTILKELPGMRPAPYLASRGLSWMQRTDDSSLSDEALEKYLRQSYAIVMGKLPKKAQSALRSLRAIPTMTPLDIRSAYTRIAPYVRRTPIIEVASPVADAPPVSLKLEFLQESGSFKARGAFHNLLTRAAPAVGCATASGGNHGAAVAFAAQRLGVRARVFAPEIALPPRSPRSGHTAPKPLSEEHPTPRLRSGATRMSARPGPYQSIHTIRRKRLPARARSRWNGKKTSTASASRRLIRCWSRLEAGGSSPESPPGSRGASRSSASSRKDRARSTRHWMRMLQSMLRLNPSLPNSLGAKRVGVLNFEIARQFVSKVVLVSDNSIAEAQQRLWAGVSIIAEPGGAAAFAALSSGAYMPEKGERVGVLVCGANADLGRLAEQR